MGQQAAGIRWLHVHPDYIVDEDCWQLLRLAANWEAGVLPEPGGVQDQSAVTVASIEVIRSAWAKLRAARDRKEK